MLIMRIFEIIVLIALAIIGTVFTLEAINDAACPACRKASPTQSAIVHFVKSIGGSHV
jgi:hypothetical protein